MDQPEKHRLSGYAVTDAVVRVEALDGGTSGAGVAVTPRHVATCAHVVLDALGLPRDTTEPPEGRLSLTRWQAGEPRTHRAQVLPDWRPVASGDIALLELLPEESDLLPACSRVLRDDQWQGLRVDAYGFPEGFDGGQCAALDCHNKIGDGRIQCSPKREGISGGYSGGPVFERGSLVGIARARRRFDDAALKYDYIVPIAGFHALLPALDGPLRQPYFALAKALQSGSEKPAPGDLAAVRRTPPHTLEEYP